LKLNLNSKTQIGRLCDGINFLGFRNILTEKGRVIRVLRQQAKFRLKSKLKFLRILKSKNIADDEYVNVRLNSFEGHLAQSKSIAYNMRCKLKYIV